MQVRMVLAGSSGSRAGRGGIARHASSGCQRMGGRDCARASIRRPYSLSGDAIGAMRGNIVRLFLLGEAKKKPDLRRASVLILR
jgi:hypothetical protein